MPTCGQLLTSSLQFAHLPTLANFVPCSKALGTWQTRWQGLRLILSPALKRWGPNFRAGDKTSIGPQMGTLATYPMTSRVPNTSEWGQNQRWPTYGQIGYIRSVSTMEGGGGLHHTLVALKLQQFQYVLRKIFFGAWYFLCFFVKVTIPPRAGGLQRGGGGSPEQWLAK